MKVLVAGNGFIGRNLVEKLREDHVVKTLDRSNGTYEQDITESFEIDEEFDVLFHTIGLAPGLYTRSRYEEVHIKGTENLMEAVEAEKVVYVSALGAGEYNHSYFETKKEVEEIVKKHSDRYTVFRPSTVFGDGNKILEVMEKVSLTRLFPDFETLMQPIHIDDMVSLLERSVEDLDGQTLEVAGPEKMTLKELGRKVYSKKGRSMFPVPLSSDLIKLGLGLSPVSGVLSRENVELLEERNTVDFNDASDILGDLRRI